LNTIEDLLEACEGIRQALLNNDVAALVQLVADDYCGFDPNGGKQDRAMMLQAYGPGGVQLDTYETIDVTTRVLGDVGLVMGVGTLSGRYGEHQFEHSLRFLDVYVHRGSAWLLSVSQVTELKTGG
jgi:ketosteroid isomerase-like protein